MKIAILSDVHLEAKPYQLQEKYLDIYNTFDYVLQLLETEHIDKLIIAGDLFDKTKISYFALKYATKLQKFKEKIFFIEGNHDEGITLFFESLGISKKTIDIINSELFIAGIDWISNHMELRQKINNLRKEIYPHKTILVLHANIYEVMPFLTDKTNYLSINDISDFKFCIIGHFHNPSLINQKFLIPGSIDRLDITNIEERKLFILEITENNKIELSFYNIPTRLIYESDNIDIIEKIINQEKLKPIIFYTGNPENISPAQFLLLEQKCLLFKIKNKASEVIDNLLNFNISLTKENVKDFIIEFFNQFPELDKELINLFINYFGQNEKIDEILTKYINQFLEQIK